MKLPNPKTYPKRAHALLIEPRHAEPDRRRQEYVLNVLIVILLGAAVLALLVATINFVSQSVPHYRDSFIITLVFTGLAAGLLLASRRGYQKPVSIIFITLLSLVATQLTLQWGFMLPQVQLLYAMIIVIAGVLLSARVSLLFSAGIIALVLIVGNLQINGTLKPDTHWLSMPFLFGDALGYVIVLMIIGLVVWLSDREIDRSLSRARGSEAALARERDNLEVKVNERTRELEETQLLRLLELRRFAEFGRLSANLLHEIANPLTAASLNLELLDDQTNSRMVAQARKNLRQLERYVTAARKQIRGQSEITSFSVRRELSQVISILKARAHKAGVKLVLKSSDNYKLKGDAVKFNQIMANIIGNAIDAYAGTERPASSKQVIITLDRTNTGLTCTVVDWGEGIPPHALSKIFEPFYSSKSQKYQNLGIGLAMVKQFVEEDFNGRIAATSTSTGGTVFSLKFKNTSAA